MRQSDIDMAERIFIAVDQLMAEEGLHNLSMHKIAKAAKISPGTIYIHFKNKEELLAQFAQQVFMCFQQELAKNIDENGSFFEQYRQMWWNIWHFLHNNPSTLRNIHQYQALPGFGKIVKEQDNSHWQIFCQKAQQAGVLADLPPNILFCLGLDSVIYMIFKKEYFAEVIPESILESVIERTWRSITK